MELALIFLNGGGSTVDINQTFIVLIPKAKDTVSMFDFRPISLYNVLYKIIVKTLANKMKANFSDVIDEAESGFVPGRLIMDNAITAFEAFHWLHKGISTHENFMAIKLVMSKAYDKVEWGILHWMLSKLYFLSHFRYIIMNCVMSVSFQVLINGVPTNIFRPERGLWQGDPLSHFFFVLCVEGCSQLSSEKWQEVPEGP